METGEGGQRLTAEDQLFMLMQAAQYLAATQGLATPEIRVCYERAESLCHSLDRPLFLYVVLTGLWRYDVGTDALPVAMKAAERVYSLAQQQNNPALMIGGYIPLGNYTLLFGRFRDREEIYDARPSDLALWRFSLRSKTSTCLPLVFFASRHSSIGMLEGSSLANAP